MVLGVATWSGAVTRKCYQLLPIVARAARPAEPRVISAFLSLWRTSKIRGGVSRRTSGCRVEIHLDIFFVGRAISSPAKTLRCIIYPMRQILSIALLCSAAASASGPGDWAQWRGPDWNGIARGDAPLTWSDTEHIKWKAEIPGRGHSSPVVWGDKIFVTTSVPTGAAAAPAADQPQPRRGGFGRGSGAQPEQKLLLMCDDRNTSRRLSSPVRQLRFELARHRRKIRDRVLRVAWRVLLRSRRQQDLGKGFRHSVAHVQWIWRRLLAHARRQHAAAALR